LGCKKEKRQDGDTDCLPIEKEVQKRLKHGFKTKLME
jgi:hypothetical protein